MTFLDLAELRDVVAEQEHPLLFATVSGAHLYGLCFTAPFLVAAARDSSFTHRLPGQRSPRTCRPGVKLESRAASACNRWVKLQWPSEPDG
jgi:hypothetical protein